MLVQEQDNLLLRDIIERNYYTFFRKDEYVNKNLNISFFYDNDYTDYKIIPNYESLEDKNANFEQIYNNFKLFLNYYKDQGFNANINIHDDKFFDNFELNLSLFNLIYEQEIKFKSLNFYISLYKFEDLNSLFNKINILNNKFHINFVFSLLISQISLFKNQDINNLNYKLNILIPPQMPSEELIFNQKIIDSNNFNINQYIEVDSDLWTIEAIEDYLKYLNYLMDNLNDLNEIFFTNLPIALQDQHVLDNTNCKKNCDFQNSLNVLIADLSINLCHKFQFKDLIIGNYIYNEENNKLEIVSKNLPTIILGAHLKRSSTPHCETCSYVNICQGFCFMRSYLKCYNPIIPIQESCLLKKIKYNFIFNKLKNQNFNIDNNLIISDLYKQYLHQILKHQGGENNVFTNT